MIAASSIKSIESDVGGRLGVAALDTGSGARLQYRGDERFAMCSTFKWLLAAAVLQKADRGETSLDWPIAYTQGDLLDHAPVTAAHVKDGALSIASLCAAAVTVSDNTAANLLLREVGGPPGLTAFLQSIGDQVTRLDRIEPELNSNLPGDPRDTTTPNAMVATMDKLLVGDVLSANARAKLRDWMRNCQTGATRLRAGLPQYWTAGDKTGNGENGAANDVAIVWPPGRAPILIASYLTGINVAEAARDGVHARVARTVVGAFST